MEGDPAHARPGQKRLYETSSKTGPEMGDEPLQNLCDEIYGLGDILACYLFDSKGRTMGTNYGEILVDDELKASFANIAAVVWGGLRAVEGLGGPIKMVNVTYSNFKLLGIPVPDSKIGILVTISKEIDAAVITERVLEFVFYWKKTRGLD